MKRLVEVTLRWLIDLLVDHSSHIFQVIREKGWMSAKLCLELGRSETHLSTCRTLIDFLVASDTVNAVLKSPDFSLEKAGASDGRCRNGERALQYIKPERTGSDSDDIYPSFVLLHDILDQLPLDSLQLVKLTKYLDTVESLVSIARMCRCTSSNQSQLPTASQLYSRGSAGCETPRYFYAEIIHSNTSLPSSPIERDSSTRVKSVADSFSESCTRFSYTDTLRSTGSSVPCASPGDWDTLRSQEMYPISRGSINTSGDLRKVSSVSVSASREEVSSHHVCEKHRRLGQEIQAESARFERIL